MNSLEKEMYLRQAIESIANHSNIHPEVIEWQREQLALEGIELKEPPAGGYDKGRMIGKDFRISETILREDPDAVARMIAVEIMGSLQRTIRLSDWFEANDLNLTSRSLI